MSTADTYRKLSESTRAKARDVAAEYRDVLLSISEAYAIMARVQADIEQRNTGHEFPARGIRP
jgi:hypothetical protein